MGEEGNGVAAADSTLQAIRYSRGKLELLDQRKLPHESEYIDIPDADAAWHAIRDMAVRGAPAIAIAGALALAVELVKKQATFKSADDALLHITQRLEYLVSSRPTAVNLSDAADKLLQLSQTAAAADGATTDSVASAFVSAAETMLRDDVEDNKRIGSFGVSAVQQALKEKGVPAENLRMLTHCNTGSLATAGYGTALGVIRSLHAEGLIKTAFCTETRPYNQGSRLTAFELVHDKIPAILIADSAASARMATGGIDAVVVGADRIAANGDTANKIGTYSLAVVAAYHNVPFFVAAPLTSIDTKIKSGREIVIEERSPLELTHALGGRGPQVAPTGITVWNPSFDVAPASLIAGIITDKGVIWKKPGSSEFDIPAFIKSLSSTDSAAIQAAAKPAGTTTTSIKHEDLEQLVIAVLTNNPKLAGMLGGSKEEWKLHEVGDGNINFVFIVSGPKATLVVKKALPYVRCVGESWPMSLDRILYESLALQFQHTAAPGLVPEVYHFNLDDGVLVMKYVAPPAIILRKGLIQGRIYARLAEDISTFLARTLFLSSLLKLDTTEHRQQVAKLCGNVEMCRLTEQVIFTEPYIVAENNRWTSPQLDADAAALRNDEQLKAAVADLKTRFCSLSQALLHADLHTGSVMVTDEVTVVIDPEFAFYGPMGFDIGCFLGELLLAFFSQDGHATADDPRTDCKKWLLQCVVDVWTLFEHKFLELWNDPDRSPGDACSRLLCSCPVALLAAQKVYMREVFLDSLGYAGAKMIRRIVGIAHVADLDSIVDPDVRANCERRALEFGKKLMKYRSHFSAIEDVAKAAAASAP